MCSIKIWTIDSNPTNILWAWTYCEWCLFSEVDCMAHVLTLDAWVCAKGEHSWSFAILRCVLGQWRLWVLLGGCVPRGNISGHSVDSCRYLLTCVSALGSVFAPIGQPTSPMYMRDAPWPLIFPNLSDSLNTTVEKQTHRQGEKENPAKQNLEDFNPRASSTVNILPGKIPVLLFWGYCSTI